MKNVIKRTIALLLVIVMAVPYVVLDANAVSGGTVDFDDAHIDAYPKLSYNEATGEYSLEIELNAEFYEGHTNTDNSTPARGYFTANYEGDYLIELWGGDGAKGPGTNGGDGGQGGYVYGKIHLKVGDTIYYSLGGSGSSTYVSGEGGGANGGGGGGNAITYGVGGGGGYSALFLFEDQEYFRDNYLDENLNFVGDNISEFDRATKYIMIAGGGGGGGAEPPSSSVHKANGGNGGGMNSQSGTVSADGTTVSGTFYAGGEGHSSGTSNEHIGHGGTTVPGKVATTWLSWSQGEKPNDWSGKYNTAAAPGAGGAGNLRGGGGGGGFCGGSGGVQENIISPNNIGGGGGGSSFISERVELITDEHELELLDGSADGYNPTSGSVSITFHPAHEDGEGHDTTQSKLGDVDVSFKISKYFRAVGFDYNQKITGQESEYVQESTGLNFSYAVQDDHDTLVTIYGVSFLPSHENLDGDLTISLKVVPKTTFIGGNDVPIIVDGAIKLTDGKDETNTATLPLNKNNCYVNVPLKLDIDTKNHSYNVTKTLGPGDMHFNGLDAVRTAVNNYDPGSAERANYLPYDFVKSISEYDVGIDGDTTFTTTTHVPVSVTLTPYDDPNIKPAAGPPTQYATTFTNDAVVTILERHQGKISGTLMNFTKNVVPEGDGIYTVSVQTTAQNDRTSHLPTVKDYGDDATDGGVYEVLHDGYYLIQAWGGKGHDGLTLTGNFLGWSDTKKGGTGGDGGYVWTWLELHEGDRIVMDPVGSLGLTHDNAGDYGTPRGGGGGSYTLISIDYKDEGKADLSNVLIAGGGGGGGNAIIGQYVNAVGADGESGEAAVGYIDDSSDMSKFVGGNGGVGSKSGLVNFTGGAAGEGAKSYYLDNSALHYSYDGTILDKLGGESAFTALTGGINLPEVNENQWSYTVANPNTSGNGAVKITCLQLTSHAHVASVLSGYKLDLSVSEYFEIVLENNNPIVTAVNNSAKAAQESKSELSYTPATVDGNVITFANIAPYNEELESTDQAGNVTYNSSIDFTVTFKVKLREGFLGGNDVPVLASGNMEQDIYVNENGDSVHYYDETNVPIGDNAYVNVPLAVSFTEPTGKTLSTTAGADVSRTELYTWAGWEDPDDWRGDFVEKVESLTIAGSGDPLQDMGEGPFQFSDNTDLTVTCGVKVKPPEKAKVGTPAESSYLTATAKVYVRPLIKYNITNLTTSDTIGSFDPTLDYEATLTPVTGFGLPTSVTITYETGGAAVPHSYDSTTGRITISAGTAVGKGNVVVTAEGVRRQYNLTYVYEVPGSNQPNYIRQTYYYGQALPSLEYTAPPVTGYSFGWQWYTNTSDGVANDGDMLATMPARDVYVVGTYTPLEYTITVVYKYREGHLPNNVTEPVVSTYGPVAYKFGNPYSIKTTALAGYSTQTPLLKGTVDEKLVTESTADKVIDGNSITFTVYYEKSEGRVRINYYDIETNEVRYTDSQTVDIGTSDSVEHTVVFRKESGYETVVYEIVDGEETLVQRDELTLNVTSDGAIIHVYYRPKKVTVNFWLDENDATPYLTRTSYYNSEFGYHSVDGVRTWESIPTLVLREGYEYDGWYPEPNGVGERVYNYTIVPAPADWNNPVINLYVKWKVEHFPIVVTHVYLNGTPAHETTTHDTQYGEQYSVVPITQIPEEAAKVAGYEAYIEATNETPGRIEIGGKYYVRCDALTGTMPNTTLSRTFYYIGKSYPLTVNYHRYDTNGTLVDTTKRDDTGGYRFGDSYRFESPITGDYADHTCSMLVVEGTLNDLTELESDGRTVDVYYYKNPPTINVTVTWSNLTFTYQRGQWDPTTHTYRDGTFTPNTAAGNQITVASESSITVDAALTYTPVSPYETAVGYFTTADEPNGSRVQKISVAKNTTANAYLWLEGRLSDSINGTFTVGKLTVTITGGGSTGT